MIATATWMPAAVRTLDHAFGARLRFVGLQGSYRRGEATEASDIDICVILDRLEPEDLAIMRAALDTLPEGTKAAGFVCGAAELRAWPKFEIFAFARDMDAWHGELAPLLPPLTEEDIRLGARTALAALHHESAQLLLAAGRPDAEAAASALHSLAKSFLRALQGVLYSREGSFPRDRAEAARLARAEEADLLRAAGNAERPLADIAAACLRWSAAGLAELPETRNRPKGPQRRRNAGNAK